jgi:EAL domain-containing protein (putative c-di-GMP-specific phosphodiesterase class I)
VRLRDAEGELHLPGTFLPPAERFHMAVAIDRWVIEHLWERLRAHPAHAAMLTACHINLSGQSLVDDGFMKRLNELVTGSPVPPEKLCFEITETAAISNLPDAQKFLQELRATGCSIALDDFGRGLSSYGYLKSLPVDILKIDGHFVRSIADNELDRNIVQSITHMAHLMGMRAVAEFVEDEAILEQVRAIGVEFAQGYAVDHPRPLDDLLATSGETSETREIAENGPAES